MRRDHGILVWMTKKAFWSPSAEHEIYYVHNCIFTFSKQACDESLDFCSWNQVYFGSLAKGLMQS